MSVRMACMIFWPTMVMVFVLNRMAMAEYVATARVRRETRVILPISFSGI